MAQNNKGLQAHQEKKREEMRQRIDETIQEMRSHKITITKKSLAEELGISERALYADYIQQFLKNYMEFNPAVHTNSTDNDEQLLTQLSYLKHKTLICLFG